LARKFAPFNFSIVPGFPNIVPTVDEWVEFLPIYKEHKDDNPAQHLCEFHEFMHQWEINHEDVLLNMFMFSLVGDAREWYHSFPPASISSLEQFCTSFNKHCQRYYSSKLIFHYCCEEYKGCEYEGDAFGELVKLVIPLPSRIEELKVDHSCFSYE
jgi:hypothetical protein